ncbi:MAG: isopentenyl-diphosphate Delta-isomerase [Bacteroidia bacterium]|jgi:isopentenyl-diphosphate delta-isomerase|nr:isopentenyl-diphosphate Delta-isomerase [Bacteroidia bacterium]MBP7261447.1 isopentenyl-diphosphate Delta-isomerase [Bacteroidia bacterium]MBP9180729.1 isopentenyl-diphosphate Delta-isomerase [Bacteroidia bacterium]MBP9724394.1 isopentenyl-diphosphate Delta-isomerase [Bacteroidia bacterium]
MQQEQVILVNESDEPIGEMEKMLAHEQGVLHRAFSVFIFNAKGEVLLQQRALSKYHSPGLWTNTCCSHPRPGETTEQAAHRRLKEEMGFDCTLQHKFSFIYKVQFDNGLYEHELDHVYTGVYEEEPSINPDEVNTFKWMKWEQLLEDVNKNMADYTFWLRQILEQHQRIV